jgi:hypothetical protein
MPRLQLPRGAGDWRYVLVAVVVMANSVAAQRGGSPPPQPLLDAGGHVRDEAFIRTPLLPGDEKYADIDGWRMKDLVREVVAISLKTKDDKTRYWGRIAGTPGEAMTADWVEGKFKQYGLTDIHRREFDLPPQWFPKDWAITFEGGGKTHVFKSVLPAGRGMGGSVPTPANGLDLEVVWVGTGTAADFAGRDVKGKAALIHSIPAPGSMGHSANYEGAIARAQEKGAAAVGIVYGISNNFAIWQGLGTAGGGTGRQPIAIPGFFMGWEDGKAVRDLLGRGEAVRLKFRLSTEHRTGLKTQSVYGKLPGTTDEDIIVMAHMDSFLEGALDNGSGLAVMMALAEHFSKVPQSQRRRSIRFIGQAGHHSGSLGSRWLHDNRDTQLAKTAVAINCEHVSVPDHKYWSERLRVSTAIAPRRWWVHGSNKLLEITLAAYRRFNVAIIGDMDGGASGEMSSMARDVPSLQVIRSPVTKHTDQDTIEWLPAVGMEQVGRSFAKIIDEVNKLDRRELLPLDPSRTEAARLPGS